MENKIISLTGSDAEITELNEQFAEFLRTKGIKAKFRLAFENMGESARKQHEKDKADFNAVKARSQEENKEFVEFLHTKGLKEKATLVMENIKNGAAESKPNTMKQISGSKTYKQIGPVQNAQAISAQTISEDFDVFLKEKGLDSKYSVIITEVTND